jgi:hypothetical protein
LIRFSLKGRPLTTAAWARRTLAAATSFMASVIFMVFFTEPMRSRIWRAGSGLEGGEGRLRRRPRGKVA